MLIVGRTGCGKITFIQKLGQSKKFGNDITQVFWVLKIFLSPEREETIRDCFVDQNVQFAYPNNIDDFNYLIDSFLTDKSQPTSENDLGELPCINKLIIMDDVSGLADKSEDFSNFLTVFRKYGFSCVFVFHTINSQNLLFDGNTNEKHQLIDRESFRDGKSSRSETSTNDKRSNESLQSEPAFAIGLRGRKLSTIRDRGNRNKDQLEGSAKKKQRFLSD